MQEFLATLLDELVPPYYLEIDVQGDRFSDYYFRDISAAVAFVKSQEGDKNIYFGVAARLADNGTKESFAGARCVWMDVDDPEALPPPLPPSIAVNSGGPGHRHYYWLLDEPVRDPKKLQTVLKALARRYGGDRGSTDVSRRLRLPGTPNRKRGTLCKLAEFHPERVYPFDDLLAVARISDECLKKIRTPSPQDDKFDRSSRDYSVMKSLIKLGMSDASIEEIFKHNPVGDKYYDEFNRGERQGRHYFDLSITNAREEVNNGLLTEETEIRIQGKAMFYGDKQISTFVLHPLAVINVGDTGQFVRVKLETGTSSRIIEWDHHVFDDARNFRTAIPLADAIWSGTAPALRALAQYCSRPSVPRVTGVTCQGRHGTLWIADRVYTAEGIGKEDTLVLVSETSRGQVPIEYVEGPLDKELLILIGEHLPRINDPEVIFPVLGWHFASPYKPVLYEEGYRFPILQLHGERGSGKTSLVWLFQKLFGYRENRSYEVQKTAFTLLNLLGATNAIPIALSEYRSSVYHHDNLLHYLRTVYDGSSAERGRPDLTIKQYPLTSPVVIEGEEPFDDAALLERTVPIFMRVAAIENVRQEHFLHLSMAGEILRTFALPYIRWTLSTPPSLEDAQQILRQIPGYGDLAERVRNNLVVIVMGMLSCARFFLEHGVEIFPIEDLYEVSRRVISHMLRFTPFRQVQVDVFLEDLITLLHPNTPWIVYELTSKGPTIWFSLPNLYQDWARRQRVAGINPPSEGTLRNQLEGRILSGVDWILKTTKDMDMYRGMEVYGLVLPRAREEGLNVPTDIRV